MAAAIRSAAVDLQPRSALERALLGTGICAWILMAAAPGLETAVAFCLSGPISLDAIDAAWRSQVLIGGWATPGLHWGLMTLAMAPLFILPALRHVLLRSLRRRRLGAAGLLLFGYFVIWALLAPLPLALHFAPAVLPGPARVIVAALVVFAVAWPLCSGRRALLRRCGDRPTLSLAGWAADRDCVRFGVAQGLVCVAVCAPLMLAVSALSHAWWPCLAAAGWLWAERVWPRFGPVALAGGPVVILAGAFLSEAGSRWAASLLSS